MKHFSIKFKHMFEASVPISTHSCPDAINSIDLFSFFLPWFHLHTGNRPCVAVHGGTFDNLLKTTSVSPLYIHISSFLELGLRSYVHASFAFPPVSYALKPFSFEVFFFYRFIATTQHYAFSFLWPWHINIFWPEILYLAWFESDLHISMFSVDEDVLQTSAANWL